MNRRLWSLSLAAGALAGGAIVVAALAAGAFAATPIQPKPEIYFRAPAEGATVGTSFEVLFGLKNYGVAPAGVKLGNTGHFHVLVDVEPPAVGVVIPADSAHLHFGAGQIETRLTLAPGRHRLRLVLADHEHRVIGADLVSAPLTVIVTRR